MGKFAAGLLGENLNNFSVPLRCKFSTLFFLKSENSFFEMQALSKCIS